LQAFMLEQVATCAESKKACRTQSCQSDPASIGLPCRVCEPAATGAGDQRVRHSPRSVGVRNSSSMVSKRGMISDHLYLQRYGLASVAAKQWEWCLDWQEGRTLGACERTSNRQRAANRCGTTFTLQPPSVCKEAGSSRWDIGDVSGHASLAQSEYGVPRC